MAETIGIQEADLSPHKSSSYESKTVAHSHSSLMVLLYDLRPISSSMMLLLLLHLFILRLGISLMVSAQTSFSPFGGKPNKMSARFSPNRSLAVFKKILFPPL